MGVILFSLLINNATLGIPKTWEDRKASEAV